MPDRIRLDIVNHAHNYAKCLAYQLSSLVLYPPKTVDVIYYLYHTLDDKPTLNVIDHFRPLMPPNVRFIARAQEISHLRQRAIGRSEIATQTDADWVWFTDTDHLFRNNCLDKLNEILATRFGRPPKDISLCFPQYVQATHHPEGLKLIAAMKEPAVMDIDPSLFWTKKMTKSIGGIQIATREICHRTRYVHWMTKPEEGWNFRSDYRFRRQCPIRHSIELPHVYRIRHGVRGYEDGVVL